MLLTQCITFTAWGPATYLEPRPSDCVPSLLAIHMAALCALAPSLTLTPVPSSVSPVPSPQGHIATACVQAYTTSGACLMSRFLGRSHIGGWGGCSLGIVPSATQRAKLEKATQRWGADWRGRAGRVQQEAWIVWVGWVGVEVDGACSEHWTCCGAYYIKTCCGHYQAWQPRSRCHLQLPAWESSVRNTSTSWFSPTLEPSSEVPEECPKVTM